MSKQKFTSFRRQRNRNQTTNRNPSREGQLRAVAHRLGMDFTVFQEYSVTREVADFELFRKGKNRVSYHLMEKQDEWMENNIKIFDYQFETGTAKSRRTVAQTVFLMKSKDLGLPQFVMKPETFLHKIASYFGKQDIDFERFPKFSGNYLLQGEDEEYIRFKMNDDILHFFSRERGWHMEGINYYLILYKENHRLKPSSVRQLYERGMGLFELLKDKPFL
ncbi:MAG: hypothetical protein AAGJ18_23535 [Bacteroidota bacterium]